jgi:aryl-alcohol dehydrogenase
MLVRLIACGICHSDIAVRDGLMGECFPCVLGHEGAGVVEQVGQKVSKVRPGDCVLLSFNSCGHCQGCRTNYPSRCIHFNELNFGWARLDGSLTIRDSKGFALNGNFFGQSSFAYYALTNERNAIPVNFSESELAMYAPLGCGIQAGSGTVLNELKPRSGQSLAIFGAGTVGLAAVMAARLADVNPIITIDILPPRLELAKELGAHHVINSKKHDPIKTLHEMIGAADTIVETTGNSQIINAAMEILSPHGKISLLGFTTDASEINVGKHQKIIFSNAGDSNPHEFIPFLISCHKKGNFPFDKLIRSYHASEINKAVKDSLKGTTIKPLLCF